MKKTVAKIKNSPKKPKVNRKELDDIQYILGEVRNPLTVIADAIKLLSDLQKETPDLEKENIIATIQENVGRLGAILDSLMQTTDTTKERGIGKFVHFDIMTKMQQVCSTHDILFLQKQIHYHISASADLPKVYANPEQILLVLSNMIPNAVKYAPRGSDIDVHIKEVSLRQGAGVEVTIINTSEEFTERDRYHIFEKFYKTKASDSSKSSGFGLAMCREIIQQSHGQLWVDIPTKGKVAFAFVVPCAEIKGPAKVLHHTFKYDITLANFTELKSKFGIEKTQNLLEQIEESVRGLVRYPVDVVTTFEQSGIVSTIYETQEGNASSVAARISQKLGSEHFRIGKNSVDLTFQYRLSTLQ